MADGGGGVVGVLAANPHFVSCPLLNPPPLPPNPNSNPLPLINLSLRIALIKTNRPSLISLPSLPSPSLSGFSSPRAIRATLDNGMGRNAQETHGIKFEARMKLGQLARLRELASSYERENEA